MASSIKEEKEYVSAPLMTVGDSAKYLGISRKSVYQLIERGELKAARRKNTILVEKRSLDDFRARGTLT